MPENNTPGIGDLFPEATSTAPEGQVAGTENPTPPVTDPVGSADPQETPPVQPENSTIRQMRETIANKDREYKTQMETLAQHLGMSVEDFLASKAKEDLAKKATENNISPELQQKLDYYDQRFKQEEEDRLRARFNSGLQEMMETYNLTQEQAAEFLRGAQARGIDVVNSPLSQSEIYLSLNRENILTSEREKIRQEILAEMQASGSTAPVGSVPGTTTSGTGKGFDDLFNDLGLNKK